MLASLLNQKKPVWINMKAFETFIAIILFAGLINALSLNVNNKAFIKGETIQLNGECKTKSILDLNIVMNEKKLFEEKITCKNNSYDFNKQISFLDPSGKWKISVLENESKEVVEKEVNVRNSKESKFHLINFLSPQQITVSRTQDIKISVKITDAGKEVENGEVNFWTPKGERKKLEYRGNGTYLADYEIPFDAVEGKWGLIVTSNSLDENNFSGGEEKIEIEIQKQKINLKLLEPFESKFNIGEEVKFKVKANYANEKKIVSGKMQVAFNEKTFDANKLNEEEFVFSIFLDGSLNEEVKGITLKVEDKAGNVGELKTDIIVSGKLFWLAKNNWLNILIAIVVVLLVLKILIAVKKRIFKGKDLEEEKDY